MDLPDDPPPAPSDPAGPADRDGTAVTGDAASVAVTDPEAGPVPPSEFEGIDAPGALDLADRVLDEVEQALARLDQGTYGTCEQCGRAVDDDRLAEYPTARVCAGCAPVA